MALLHVRGIPGFRLLVLRVHRLSLAFIRTRESAAQELCRTAPPSAASFLPLVCCGSSALLSWRQSRTPALSLDVSALRLMGIRMALSRALSGDGSRAHRAHLFCRLAARCTFFLSFASGQQEPPVRRCGGEHPLPYHDG